MSFFLFWVRKKDSLTLWWTVLESWWDEWPIDFYLNLWGTLFSGTGINWNTHVNWRVVPVKMSCHTGEVNENADIKSMSIALKMLGLRLSLPRRAAIYPEIPWQGIPLVIRRQKVREPLKLVDLYRRSLRTIDRGLGYSLYRDEMNLDEVMHLLGFPGRYSLLETSLANTLAAACADWC